MTKIMHHPLWKNANFAGFWKRCYHSPERGACYIKRWKSFFTIDFHDLLHRDTGDYKGLQGVTGAYMGIHWVTGGYKRLKRTCFLTRTSPDTFSWSVLHKNQRWRNLKFLTKTMDQNLWKHSNFAFFINSCFYSL